MQPCAYIPQSSNAGDELCWGGGANQSWQNNILLLARRRLLHYQQNKWGSLPQGDKDAQSSGAMRTAPRQILRSDRQPAEAKCSAAAPSEQMAQSDGSRATSEFHKINEKLRRNHGKKNSSNATLGMSRDTFSLKQNTSVAAILHVYSVIKAVE